MKYGKYIASAIAAAAVLGTVTASMILINSGKIKLPFLQNNGNNGNDIAVETSETGEQQIATEERDDTGNTDVSASQALSDNFIETTAEMSDQTVNLTYQEIVSVIPEWSELAAEGYSKQNIYISGSSRLCTLPILPNTDRFFTDVDGITFFELYMGYILCRAEDGTVSVMDSSGTIVLGELGDYTPVYARNSDGKPLFSREFITAELISETKYYVIGEAGDMIETECNPALFPALKIDGGYSYGNSSIELYPFEELVWVPSEISEEDTQETEPSESEFDIPDETTTELPAVSETEDTFYETEPDVDETYVFSPDDVPETDPSMLIEPDNAANFNNGNSYYGQIYGFRALVLEDGFSNESPERLTYADEAVEAFDLSVDETESEESHEGMEQISLWGYKDRSGNVVIEPIYGLAYTFSENGLAAVVDYESGALLFINKNGQQVINPYGNILYPADRNKRPVYDGYFLPEILDDSCIGMFYFDHGLVMVRRCQYDYYKETVLVSDELELIYANGKEYPIPESYKLISYSEGVMLLEKDGYYGLLSYTGKWIAQPIYTYAEPFKNGLAVIGHENGKKGMIDISGETVLPIVFDYISGCSDGLVLTFRDGDKWHAMAVMEK